ncbi:MAG: transcriptional regulator AsnC [Kangiella sp.]|nr:transcriptional regulator AsnC [Kangiella sp.]
MQKDYQIDNLDKSILSELLCEARTPYAKIAEQLNVSPGTIHVRIEKMRQAGIIKGTKVRIEPKALGFDVCCFVGIFLKSAKDYQPVAALLEQIPEVIEAYYTTGQYSILTKVVTPNIETFQDVLINKLQAIEQVRSTETMISLQNPIHRDIDGLLT